MLTAYFSVHYDWVKDSFFGAVPVNRADWVSQFPSVYFAGQKLVFAVLGLGIYQTMVSTLPYVYITAWSLFVLGSSLLTKKLGLVAVILYAFFPPSLYLETIGLQFSMSTAIYSLLLVGLLGYWSTKRVVWAMLSGIVAGFAYLGYTSSYIALPVILGFFAVLIITQAKIRRKVVVGGLIALGCFLITWLPFGVYILTNNYLVQRTNQVALLGGEWSADKDPKLLSAQRLQALGNHTINSVRSLVIDGIGGHGGYNFGQQRLLQPVGLGLLIIGLVTVCYLIVIKRQGFWGVILVSVLFAFAGVVFSIPPPAFHRFSLAFPLIILIMSAAFYFVMRLPINRYVGGAVIIIALITYGVTNLTVFQQMVKQEVPNDNILMAKMMNNYCGEKERRWYVAAFPGFALEKILYVLGGNQQRLIMTDYHVNLLKSFNRYEKYCYAILFPQEFNSKFYGLDVSGKIIPVGSSYSLFVN
jgi:hypothetical protein